MAGASKPPWARFVADEVDAGWRGRCRRGVLAGAGGGDAGAARSPSPSEGGVEAGGGEGGVASSDRAGSGAGPGSRARPASRTRAATIALPSIARGSAPFACCSPLGDKRQLRVRDPSGGAERARRARTEADDRQQGEAEDERRRQVAETRFEAARHPVGARGGGRGDEPGRARRRADQARKPARDRLHSSAGPPPTGRGHEGRSEDEAGEREQRRAAARAIQRPSCRPGRNQSDQTEPSVR